MSTTNLTEIFDTYDSTVESTSGIRKKIIAKLEKIVDELSIQDDDSASKIEAKTGIINTLDNMLKSYEAGYANNIKVKLQNKHIDNNTDVKAQAIEILKNISINQIGLKSLRSEMDQDKIATELEKIVDAQCIPINEEELAED